MSRKPDTNNQRQDHDTGSPLPGESVFLAVGRFRHAHGVKGEITMDVLTDFPERLDKGKEVFAGERRQLLRIKSMRWKDTLLLLSFEGYEDCDQVNELRNQILYVRGENLPPLPDGHYYFHQLRGLKVQDESGELLGILDEILETGANDVYMVHSMEGKEILLPAIKTVILNVNLEKGEMVVHPPEWE
jgi:16S rRNA processing protein RimM